MAGALANASDHHLFGIVAIVAMLVLVIDAAALGCWPKWPFKRSLTTASALSASLIGGLIVTGCMPA
ncbi:hypothetical protein [Sphingomonas sp. 3-13AW]|uniref:hypothetical protein n=1 Tax=Sphingomonas sp. 3-13AW TaxID=3050450 RepID=UPI003BB7B9F5